MALNRHAGTPQKNGAETRRFFVDDFVRGTTFGRIGYLTIRIRGPGGRRLLNGGWPRQ